MAKIKLQRAYSSPMHYCTCAGTKWNWDGSLITVWLWNSQWWRSQSSLVRRVAMWTIPHHLQLALTHLYGSRRQWAVYANLAKHGFTSGLELGNLNSDSSKEGTNGWAQVWSEMSPLWLNEAMLSTTVVLLLLLVQCRIQCTVRIRQLPMDYQSPPKHIIKILIRWRDGWMPYSGVSRDQVQTRALSMIPPPRATEGAQARDPPASNCLLNWFLTYNFS